MNKDIAYYMTRSYNYISEYKNKEFIPEPGDMQLRYLVTSRVRVQLNGVVFDATDR